MIMAGSSRILREGYQRERLGSRHPPTAWAVQWERFEHEPAEPDEVDREMVDVLEAPAFCCSQSWMTPTCGGVFSQKTTPS